jgi:hypothetical protein
MIRWPVGDALVKTDDAPVGELTNEGGYDLRRSIGKSGRLVPLPLFAVAVASMVGGCASDRNGPYDQTRNSFNQLAPLIVAVHNRDPVLLKKSTLHDILRSASQLGYLSQGEFEHGFHEQDAWGNAFRISYSTRKESDVFIIASPGPNATAGKKEELSLEIVFRHGSEPTIVAHGFP